MEPDRSPHALPPLPRIPTRVPGLDAVLSGGLVAGDAYLVSGGPGTGKTTLGNQIAFAHAAAGGNVLVATLLTETHDRMLAHLRSFGFADQSLVGTRLRYVSLLGALQDGGLNGVLAALTPTLRQHAVDLLIVDGAGAAGMLAPSGFDHARFVHALQARTALLGCTTVLLSDGREADTAAAHVDGVIELANEVSSARDARWLRVAKLRGSGHLDGRHRFAIGEGGVAVFPRLEAALAGLEPRWHDPEERVPFGVPGLDAMTGGGPAAGSTTMVLGTPGAGKTVLGLHFLAEGARRGEPGLLAGFHETSPALASTAHRAGIGLGSYLDSGLVRVLWRPALQMAPDEWAWQMLAAVEEHRPRRLVIDAFTDLVRLFDFDVPQRQAHFAQALAYELRHRGVTALINFEVDSFVGPHLAAPVPNISAIMDNGILLRTVEFGSSLRRLVSVLKERETGFDATIREFTIGPGGISVGEPLGGAGLLTGSAVPDPGPSGGS